MSAAQWFLFAVLLVWAYLAASHPRRVEQELIVRDRTEAFLARVRSRGF